MLTCLSGTESGKSTAFSMVGCARAKDLVKILSVFGGCNAYMSRSNSEGMANGNGPSDVHNYLPNLLKILDFKKGLNLMEFQEFLRLGRFFFSEGTGVLYSSELLNILQNNVNVYGFDENGNQTEKQDDVAYAFACRSAIVEGRHVINESLMLKGKASITPMVRKSLVADQGSSLYQTDGIPYCMFSEGAPPFLTKFGRSRLEISEDLDVERALYNELNREISSKITSYAMQNIVKLADEDITTEIQLLSYMKAGKSIGDVDHINAIIKMRDKLKGYIFRDKPFTEHKGFVYTNDLGKKEVSELYAASIPLAFNSIIMDSLQSLIFGGLGNESSIMKGGLDMTTFNLISMHADKFNIGIFPKMGEGDSDTFARWSRSGAFTGHLYFKTIKDQKFSPGWLRNKSIAYTTREFSRRSRGDKVKLMDVELDKSGKFKRSFTYGNTGVFIKNCDSSSVTYKPYDRTGDYGLGRNSNCLVIEDAFEQKWSLIVDPVAIVDNNQQRGRNRQPYGMELEPIAPPTMK